MRVKEIWDRIEADVFEESQLQIPEPEKGPLERRIGRTYEDALFEDHIDMNDTSYWFTTPEGGWNMDPRLIPKAKEVPFEMASSVHPGEDRIPLSDIKEGQVLDGIVTRQMLVHGAQVDLGAEFDGLIPVTHTQWTEEVCRALWLDEPVRVRVYKVRDTRLHRFPIQLELLSPMHISSQLSPPEDHHSPLDLRGQDDMKLLEEYTGRVYKPSKYWAEFSPSDAEIFFQDKSRPEEELEDVTETPYSDFNVRARVSDIAAEL